MIRVKCPKCARSVGVPDAQAGGVGSCPECGQRFRVPTPAARPEPAPPPRSAEAAPPARRTPGGKQPALENAYPTRPPEESLRTEDDDNQYDERSDDEDEGPRVVRRRKKKKKHRQEPESSRLSGAHVALAVVGLLVVALATGLFFLIQHGAFTRAKPNPAEVLAELEKAGAQIDRDRKSPDQPIIGISLNGREFRPSLLGRLVAFPQLRKLNLAGTLTSDINLEHLEDVTSLQVLNLSHTKVTGGGMQFLKNLVNLEELDLTQTLVTDVGLRELTGLKKLKRLHLSDTLASGQELEAAIPGLQVFK